MRSIGHLNQQDEAVFFSDYLSSKGIENELESHKDGSWTVWIFSEDQVAPAHELLERFRRDPEDLEFNRTSVQERLREQQKEEAATEQRQQVFTRKTLWPERRTTHLTLALIIVSCAVSFFSGLGENTASIRSLFISDGFFSSWAQAFPEVRQGQVWRLVTPIFIHFGFMHLLFNMMWLKDLGGMIEQRKGTLMLALLVLAIAVSSNSAQYVLKGSNFGGMSGVVYGLLGYAWMKGKFDPASGLKLHSSTVVMMIVWFLLGFTDLIGSVANIVHAGGLLVGVAWGYLSSPGRFRSLR
ncbi:MAG: hypothetical protein A2X46_03780 [Lentisphaerae bacterium GWF2_57_35]|nr:MAG: hypothetical protein A2X46_03780 [Lentisphaerae bacterium GWF2_57_35]